MKKYEQLTIQEHTSKWLRKRVDQSILKSSVSSLIPDKETTDDQEVKKKLLKPKYYDFYNKENSKVKLNINPKYLFTDSTLKKIIKLRNIFLEFDEDGSKMLELHELMTMFETNNIPVSMHDLLTLFFNKNTEFKKNEEPYLDFYQLFLFALDPNCEFKFRNFMRKIKQQISFENTAIFLGKNFSTRLEKQNTIEAKLISQAKRQSIKSLNNYDNKNTRSRSLFVNNNKEELIDEKFLPMNFKLLLEFFNSKGKMRESEQKINKMTDLMNLFEVNEETSNDYKHYNQNSNMFTINSERSINKQTTEKKSSVKKQNKNTDFIHNDIDLNSVVKNFQRMLYHSRISSDDNDFFKTTLKLNNERLLAQSTKNLPNPNENLDSLENNNIILPAVDAKRTYYTQESIISALLKKKKEKSRISILAQKPVKNTITLLSEEGVKKQIKRRPKPFSFGSVNYKN